MLTLFGSLLGFIGSLIPDIFRLFRDKNDQSHELAILDRQIDMQKVLHSQKLDEIQAQRQVVETASLYRHARFTGVKWVDALSGTVRPVLTYAFFILYMGIKIAGLWILLEGDHDFGWQECILSIWHEEDRVLFAAVMAFWFGHRAMAKRRGQ